MNRHERVVIRELRRILDELHMDGAFLRGVGRASPALMRKVADELAVHDADPMLRAIVESCRQTQTIAETAEMLKDWTASGGLHGWRSEMRRGPLRRNKIQRTH